MSKIFPLDLVLLAIILLYFFVSSLFGLIKLGFKFLFMEVSSNFLEYCRDLKLNEEKLLHKPSQ
jgi:hypothetical protein